MRDRDIGALIERLGIAGIVDAHVHFMEPSILAKVWAYFDAAGPKLGRPWPVQYRGSDEERVAQLRSFGVKKFSALSYAHRPGVATMMNDWTQQFAEYYPDALWSATFYPEPGAAAYVADLVARGVEIFKVHVQVGEFAPDDPLLDPVWAVLNESRTPVVLHAGSGPVAGPHTGPRGVEAVLEKFEKLSLIIAHLGMPEYEAFLDLAQRYEHVRLDTTMVFVDFWGKDYSYDHLTDRLLELEHKILFGTDFPNIPYQYAHQIEALERLGLGDDWMRSVLWHNGAQLFGIDQPDLSYTG